MTRFGQANWDYSTHISITAKTKPVKYSYCTTENLINDQHQYIDKQCSGSHYNKINKKMCTNKQTIIK